jgi:hypothetical protein
MNFDAIPSPNASPELHADFFEISALLSPAGSYSIQEFAQALRIGNATETVEDSLTCEDDYEIDDPSEGITQAAFDEIDERRRHFGGMCEHYPFDSTESTLTLRPDAAKSVYAFLALLSYCGKDAGPKETDAEKIFERICQRAAQTYLGGADSGRTQSVVFGFPRRDLSPAFSEALDELCQLLGEGQAGRKERPPFKHQKDAKVDIVSWIEFQDRRPGKLISFGQCATGRKWKDKINELPDTAKWCSQWMKDSPLVSPLRSFFVPHRVERDDWDLHGRYGGILYDRCRIASLAIGVHDDLRDEWTNWSAYVIKNLRDHRR